MTNETHAKPSLAQLHVLVNAARLGGTKHMVKTATAKTLVARGWATAEAGHRTGIWSVTITPAGQGIVDASTEEQRHAAYLDSIKIRRPGGKGHRFGGDR